MAVINDVTSELFLIQVGDGATVESFVTTCLVNTGRGLEKTATTTTRELPDCSTPSTPYETRRTTVATDSSISGEGILQETDAKTFFDAVGTTKNIKVRVGSVTGALILTGAYILESFSLTGGRLGDAVTCSMKWVQAAAPTATAAA